MRFFATAVISLRFCAVVLLASAAVLYVVSLAGGGIAIYGLAVDEPSARFGLYVCGGAALALAITLPAAFHFLRHAEQSLSFGDLPLPNVADRRIAAPIAASLKAYGAACLIWATVQIVAELYAAPSYLWMGIDTHLDEAATERVAGYAFDVIAGSMLIGAARGIVRALLVVKSWRGG